MSTFRSAPEPQAEKISLPEPKKNEYGSDENLIDAEPLEMREDRSGDIVLESLGIDDSLRNLPEEDQENVGEVKQYVKDIMKSKGVSETFGNFKKTLDSIKSEMGLDADADPQIILDRIGGVVKAWKSLAFITNPKEKRSFFMKLAKLDSSSEMNRLVFEEMNKRQVWQ